MVIGICGRGGTGKTTLSKMITNNHNNFIHIEVDKIIDEKLSKSKRLIERVNSELGNKKKYTFNDIKNSYFEDTETSSKIDQIFLDELNKEILKEIKDESKNYVVEHFILNRIDMFKDCDIKIKLHAPKKEREKRIIKRGDMSLEQYRKVDSRVSNNDKTTYDFKFNIEDYQKELISIIVPVYNAEEYIEKTLEAILCQTYKNIEVILVNDGSTDNTLSILNKYQKKDNRIKVITTKNMNVSNARNTGLKHAKGKYISFIDSDDLINKEYIACLYDAIKLTNSDYAHAKISVEREGINGYVSTTSPKLIKIEDPKKAYLRMDTKFAVWGKLFKIELIKDIEFDKIPCFEDFKYMWEVSKKAKSAVITSDATYRYIQRTKNSLTQKDYNDTNKELIKHAYKVLEDSHYQEDAKKFFYGCLLFNILLFLKSYNPNNTNYKYNVEVYNCIKALEEYKDYKFNLLEYNDLDIDEILDKAKKIVCIDTIGIFWPPMSNNVEEAIKIVKKK